MNELNMDRFTKALSEILSRKYDAKITITAIPKNPNTVIPKEPEKERQAYGGN